jgi:hypothetical protein
VWKEISLAPNTQKEYNGRHLKLKGKNIDLKREIVGAGHKSWKLGKLIA